jgi:hypothetical protein
MFPSKAAKGEKMKEMPNKDRNPTKRKGPVKEPVKEEEMVLERPRTSTDRASGGERTSTVTDGEDG